MADVTLTYKGNTIAEMNDSGTKTLKTAGKYCEGDIRVYYEKTTSGGTSDELAKNLIERKLSKNIFGDIILPKITELPSGITQIGDYAFYKAKLNLNLTSLPNSVTSIGDYAFYDCLPNLTSLPNSVTSIGDYAFAISTYVSGAGIITRFSLPSSIETVGNYVFANLSNKTFTFEGTPTSIGSHAFDDCPLLTTINVPWSKGEVDGAPWGARLAVTINYNYTTT